jgi:hypothetical protein
MKKLLLTTAIITIAFTACKKSSVEEPLPAQIPTIVGLWKGKFSVSLTTQPTQDVIYNFKSNGTVEVYNGTDIATATAKANGFWNIIKGAIFGGGGYGALVNVEYTYSTAPTVYYSTRFQPDENQTKSISPTIWDQWGTGRVYYDLSSFTPKGYLTLTKQ